MQGRAQRKLSAVLAADVVGFSRLMGADDEGTLGDLKLHREELIDPCIAEHGGRIVKVMGDGLLVEFPSVVDAVRSALTVQEEMLVRNADHPLDKRITFRIGINLGDIIVDGDDILGEGVNIAARLEAIAEPGGICLSQRVYEDVQNRLELEFVDLGLRELKNISRPIHCWAWSPGEKRNAKPKTSADVTRQPALAVLPFNNFSSDPEFEFFADGLSEDLTTLLSGFREFPVIARNSAFTFKGNNVDVTEAGNQLGAAYVVEGSVRVAGKRMRVNAQLIDVASGHHLWAQKFDRDIEDIFALQDELSLQIASNISPSVGRNESTRVATASMDDIDLWSALHKVRSLTSSFTLRSNEEAHSVLLRLEREFPPNSTVQAILAMCENIFILTGVTPWREGRKKVAQYARRAIEIDPANHLAQNWLSCAEQYYGRLEAALDAAERSIELNPSASQGYFWRGTNRMLMGQAEESLSDFAMMERLSPLDPWIQLKHVAMARALFILGRYQEAAEASRLGVEIAPDIHYYRLILIVSLALAGRMDEARREAAIFESKFTDADLKNALVNFRTRDPSDLARFLDGLKLVDMAVGESQ